MRSKIKFMISIALILSMMLCVINVNAEIITSSTNTNSLKTSIIFITDDKDETEFIDNISSKVIDQTFLKNKGLKQE